jgi:uncharacterized protein
MIDPTKLPEQARKADASTRQLFKKLKKNPPRHLDTLIQELHGEVFARVDCLTCANCCKTTSPVFTNKDIDRIARYLRMKPGQFIEEFLHIDEDNDYVLNVAPCPFLEADNHCRIYEHRPTACREYPHTDRKNIHQLLDLTRRNTHVCPAVFTIVEKLKDTLKQ